MEEVYISNPQTGIPANTASEETQVEIGDKLNDIKDILLSAQPIYLDGLEDINLDNPTNGQIIQYNSSESKWENVVMPSMPSLVDRGDPTGYDFIVGDFTTDATWRDLDLSSIVPAGVIAVDLSCTIKAITVGSYMLWRKNGNLNNFNRKGIRTQAANVTKEGSFTVPCDTNRVIEYYGSNVSFIDINVTVTGWQ